ncbi:MAG TPA: DUF2169 domain-containing protein, partial [Polyangiaceae bacterium]|nr:DUF2169 domain-containing protein [Polyangiaceae bacterium]
MRARSMSPVPLGLGVVWFRDPVPRIAILAKVALRIDVQGAAARLELGTKAPIVFPMIDLVPRKSRVDVIVTGEAESREPGLTIPVEIAIGATFKKRAGAIVKGGVPATRATLRGLGPTPLSLRLAPARTAKEAMMSPGWLDIPREGQQIAPLDQQAWESVVYGTPITLLNLSPRGGAVELRAPSFTPYALLHESAGLSGAHRVPMRCDTVDVDASAGTVTLSFRGEVEADRFASAPEVVVGLLSGQRQPTGADLEAALAREAT